MTTGAKQNEILLLKTIDLVAPTAANTNIVESAIWDTRLVTFAVAREYEEKGPKGLIRRLEAEGHLNTDIGEKAITEASRSLRNDPSIREVMAELDSDDAEDFLSYAVKAVITEALQED